MTLIDDWAGGVPGGRKIQAVTMAGLSGGFLAGDDLDVTLDEPDIRSKEVLSSVRAASWSSTTPGT